MSEIESQSAEALAESLDRPKHKTKESDEERRRKARERKQKSRQNLKLKAHLGVEQSSVFEAYCRRRGLTWFGFHDWDTPAQNWDDGLRICKNWARVSGQEGPKPGETLFDFENRVYGTIEVFEAKTSLFVSPLMNGNFTGYDPNREFVSEKSYLSARVRELDSWPDDRQIVN